MINMANEMVYNDTVSEVINDSDISMDQLESKLPPNRQFTLQIWPFHVQVGVAVLCGLLTLLTVTGNLVVLSSYVTTKKLRTYANYFICGLALVDLTDGAIVIPLFSVYWIMGIWPFSQQLCEAYRFFSHMTTMTSYYLTLVICIDRYRALSQPLKHLQQRSRFRAASMMSVAFLMPIIFCIGLLIIWPHFGKNVPPLFTSMLCYPQYARINVFALAASLFIAWIPLLLICALYLQVFWILKQRRDIEKQDVKSAQRSVNTLKTNLKNEKHAALNESSSTKTNVGDKSGVQESGLVNKAFETDGFQDKTENDVSVDAKPDVHCVVNVQSFKNKIEQQNVKAARVLSLIVLVMFVTRLPWSIFSVYSRFCGGTCTPLNLYQVK